MIKLAVVGTRVLKCEGDRQRVLHRVWASINRLKPDVFISGGAEGVDQLAEHIARQRGYTENNGNLMIFRPSRMQFEGKGGYRERNEKIAIECTHLLRLSCLQGRTFGSGWTADRARHYGANVVDTVICKEPPR